NRSTAPLSSGAPDALRDALSRVKKRASGDVGDYYEFGIYRGGAFVAAQQICRDLGIESTHFYGFDSFQGLPPVEGIDETDGIFYEGQYAASKEAVVRNLTREGVDWDRTTLIEGFFSDSLTEETKQAHPFRDVAVALIDCDLYSSTQEVLSWLDDYLVDGSILLFDDWESFGDDGDLGQKRAFAEFLEERPDLRAEPLLSFEPHGEGFVMRRES
ncbi:MAG: TylF/MycF/NovP-related O-methyltransferase, partial [Halobacteriales archaeon]|nr:TylF/MycF/NovP-related O-methyltransferase [Halobacteriales archaeon]